MLTDVGRVTPFSMSVQYTALIVAYALASCLNVRVTSVYLNWLMDLTSELLRFGIDESGANQKIQ